MARLRPPIHTGICRDQDFHVHFSACSYDEVFHNSAVLSLWGNLTWCIKTIAPLSSKIFVCEVRVRNPDQTVGVPGHGR